MRGAGAGEEEGEGVGGSEDAASSSSSLRVVPREKEDTTRGEQGMGPSRIWLDSPEDRDLIASRGGSEVKASGEKNPSTSSSVSSLIGEGVTLARLLGGWGWSVCGLSM